jgi:hypothetical protein
MLNLAFTAIFGACFLVAIVFELIGVANKKDGDTITENWRWINAWLSVKVPAVGWIWRVATLGFLTWMILHFGAGVD